MLTKTSRAKRRGREKRESSSAWQLQSAKARFSELLRRAKSEGPQLVTVHGREEAFVISAADFARLSAAATPKPDGRALVEAFRDPRLPADFTFERVTTLPPPSRKIAFDDR